MTVLGSYTVRKTGNANSVTLPASSGFSVGDKVVLILEPNGDITMRKQDKNFWDLAPAITEEQERQDIEDLGYDPLNQNPVGEERIEE